jgi:hypothetical protein
LPKRTGRLAAVVCILCALALAGAIAADASSHRDARLAHDPEDAGEELEFEGHDE